MSQSKSIFPRDIESIEPYLLRDEEAAKIDLLNSCDTYGIDHQSAFKSAASLIEHIRVSSSDTLGVESLLREYSLSETEGILLMCLAESLLRVPDSLTANRLIADKLVSGDWDEYIGQADSWLINASSWGLFLTGRFLDLGRMDSASALASLKRTVRRVGEPVIRASVKVAMQVMGKQFVLGEDLGEAFKKASSWESKGYRYSYDMLGEGARTMKDADRYLEAYADAIRKIGAQARGMGPVEGPGISIKLSALHPRYNFSQDDRVQTEVFDRLMGLTEMARDADINLTIDAEEADRLTLSMRLIKRAMEDGGLGDWNGFGLAVQAYHKATPVVLNYIRDLAADNGRRMMVRLVKGAYWDYEIKHAQEGGYQDFPVYTRKTTTDVSYITCAAQMLEDRDWLYPQFATHNAITTSAILSLTNDYDGFEFQRLHGMGEHLYDGLKQKGIYTGPVRIYAPVGEHEHLLAYLVRRLLENGANSSFVNKVSDPEVPVESLLVDPIAELRANETAKHPKIELPSRILGERTNSNGWNLETTADQEAAYSALDAVADKITQLCDSTASGESYTVVNPTKIEATLGTTTLMSVEDCVTAIDTLDNERWASRQPSQRADALFQLADALETHKTMLSALLITEAGKLGSDADAEVREAIDFCRYYAMDAQRTDSKTPLGTVLCISPWNFPLAIFLGQVTAALAAGNTVLAKPSEQAMLIAKYAVELAHEAGVPTSALRLIPTDGPTAGEAYLKDERVKGVIFTGSTATAQHIQSVVASRGGRFPVIVAETGGQNGMVVDSTALPEQVTDDVIRSGFQSAGQRCSALRVLYLQEDVADGMIEMIVGAMKELRIGDPSLPSTDVGPVIDDKALARLEAHQEFMKSRGKLHYQCELPAECEGGYFFPPTLYEIDNIDVLQGEVFGPIVHVVRYKAKDFHRVFDAINSTGFGLTMGVHSRIDDHVAVAVNKSHAGNIYVNRNIIGAVVGVQPFGGAGLSGTGPKAGGPNYVSRLVNTVPLEADSFAYGEKHGAVSSSVDWMAMDIAARWELFREIEGERINAFAWAKRLLEERISLPGPTGEANTLEYRARGSVWIDPTLTRDDQRQMMILALLSGNTVGVASGVSLPEGWELFEEVGAIERVGIPSAEAHYALLAANRFDVLVLPADDELINATTMAKKALPIIVDFSDAELALQRFVHEVTVSVNTTAAGGNAALMADID